MDWVMDLAIFFGLVLAMMLSGMPVAFGFITLNIIGLYMVLGVGSLSLLATSSFSSIGQFSLIPIPLFILMGELLLRTGLAGKTVEAVDQWIGRLPGRLSLSSVGGGTLFGALSVQAWHRLRCWGQRWYQKWRGADTNQKCQSVPFSPVVVSGFNSTECAGSSIRCPGESVHRRTVIGWNSARHFVGNHVFLYFALRAKFQPELAPPYDAPPTTFSHKLYTLLTVSPLLALIVVVTGFIFLGIATPSESAAMGVVATLIVAACYGRLNWAAVKKRLCLR